MKPNTKRICWGLILFAFGLVGVLSQFRSSPDGLSPEMRYLVNKDSDVASALLPTAANGFISMDTDLSRDPDQLLTTNEIASITQLRLSDYEISGPRFAMRWEWLNGILTRHRRITDADLAQLPRFTSVESLYLVHASRITDAGLEHVLKLPKLCFLELYGTQMTEAGMEQICKISSLYTLYLHEPQITDEWLKHLEQLPHLRAVSLTGTQVTDAGMTELLKHTGLMQVCLPKGVTDAGLLQLASLTNLDNIILSYDCPVTPEGIEWFQKKLPKCEFARPTPPGYN